MPKLDQKEKPKGQTQQTFELENLMGQKLTTPDGEKIKIVGYDQSNKKHPRIVVETEGKKGETIGYDKKQIENWIKGKKEEKIKTESKGIDKLDLSENKFHTSFPMFSKREHKAFASNIYNDDKQNNIFITNGKAMLIMKKTNSEDKFFGNKKSIRKEGKEASTAIPPYKNIRFDDDKNTTKTSKSISDMEKQIKSIDKEKIEYRKNLEKELFDNIKKENLAKNLQTSPSNVEKQAKEIINDIDLIIDKNGKITSKLDFKTGKEKDVKENETFLSTDQLKKGLKTIKNTRGNVKNLNITIKDKNSIFKLSANNQDIEYYLMPKK